MKTLREISNALRRALKACGQTQAQLQEAAGITQRTLTNVLSGEQDFKVTTLLAVADRLGLELMLVPKAAVRGLAPSQDLPSVMTLVQQGRTAIRQSPQALAAMPVANKPADALDKARARTAQKQSDKGGSNGS